MITPENYDDKTNNFKVYYFLTHLKTGAQKKTVFGPEKDIKLNTAN